MNGSLARSLAAVACVAAVGFSAQAHAAASVSVENSFSVGLSWMNDLTDSERAQIDIDSTFAGWSANETRNGHGSLAVSHYSGDGGTIHARADADRGGYASGTYELGVSVHVTNRTGRDLSGLALDILFSAFAPFGSTGAQVDLHPSEYALFSSSQSGDSIGDTHACDTRGDEGIYGWVPAPGRACGVMSPDYSESSVWLDIGAGQTASLGYTLSITVEAFSVIEPASLALFAPSVLGLAALRRRRAA